MHAGSRTGLDRREVEILTMGAAKVLFGEVPSGYGYGSGYGSGYGDGSKEYWASVLPVFITKWPTEQQIRTAELQKTGATIAYWRSDASGKPCNGGNGVPVFTGHKHKIAGPLQLCGRRALHATMTPPAWSGERVWIVALHGEVAWEGDKCGALEREILGECLP